MEETSHLKRRGWGWGGKTCHTLAVSCERLLAGFPNMVCPAFHFGNMRHLRLCQLGLDACQKRGVSPALLGISEKALRGALAMERVPLPRPLLVEAQPPPPPLPYPYCQAWETPCWTPDFHFGSLGNMQLFLRAANSGR